MQDKLWHIVFRMYFSILASEAEWGVQDKNTESLQTVFAVREASSCPTAFSTQPCDNFSVLCKAMGKYQLWYWQFRLMLSSIESCLSACSCIHSSSLNCTEQLKGTACICVTLFTVAAALPIHLSLICSLYLPLQFVARLDVGHHIKFLVRHREYILC